MTVITSNFSFLTKHDPLLLQLAQTAEKSFVADPNTTLLKLRQLGEALAQDIASRLGIEYQENVTQLDLIRKIQFEVDLGREVTDTFHSIRKIGNQANHEFTSNHREAIQVLKLSWNLSIWYHRTFGNPTSEWNPGAFVKPEDPSSAVRELEERIAHLEKAKLASQRQLNIAEQLTETEKKKTEELAKYAEAIREESETWQAIAQEQEIAHTEAQQAFVKASTQTSSAARTDTKQAKEQVAHVKDALSKSIWYESEAETRLRIDQQLIDAGWQADTENIRHSKGARPEPGVNKAIAEWPTQSGPADYVLFRGLTAIATIEAKKSSKSVAGDIDQAERYSATISESDDYELPDGSWLIDQHDASAGAYRIPFAFASNGRPYLVQNKELSGIWFRDLRRPQNQRKSMDGWYSPSGLNKLLKQDLDAAEANLDEQSFNFDFQLRDYQKDAIKAIEQAIIDGDQTALVAMATGTGKTKTCIALIYRLLKAKRFRRFLFLVDRSALGEQATDAFETTQMFNQQTFADTFNIKGLKEANPDDDTEVHVATVQGMVQRTLYADDNKPTVDQYDCIVIDECHRGYLLDRELNDTEIKFRSEKDYISKYRRVIEYFDAVKIGLTATPALHTTEIFGVPVYQYSYTEAVIDGFLVDHDPPIHIKTKFNQKGLKYALGEKIEFYDVDRSKVDYVHLPDEVNFDIGQLNREVEVEGFNRIVCDALADQIDPFGEQKTLIFCVTDRHADMVTRLMKEAITKSYGECEDGLVKKITGAADKPLEQIRRYKNERLPCIAVTVDLLTTGIDVPAICNLVFIRPVKSRILYEQMKGRATRPCSEIGKEAFRIFDAVNLYDNLEPLTNMKPVVVNPNITFTQLVEEITGAKTHNAVQQEHARDQLIAKLQRKKRNLSDKAKDDFETKAGLTPDAFVDAIKDKPIKEVADWFVNHPDLGELLDKKAQGIPPIIFISDKEDTLIEVTNNYGKSITPGDFLKDFKRFIRDNENKLIALKTLVRQPGQITRQQIKELLMELADKQFTETNLRKAWAMQTNQDIAARIVGYVRKAALGDALVPWEQRVDTAIAIISTQQSWKPAQKTLLKEIGTLLKKRLALDEQSINESQLIKKYGRFERINKIFDGRLPHVLESINGAVWQSQPAQQQ
jgi:type I restriction enzyme R subunit